MLAPTIAIILHFNSAIAAAPARVQPPAAASVPTSAMPTAAGPPSRTCAPASHPPMALAIAFTSNVHDTIPLNLHLPWGKPGDAEGRMVEDYGAYDGDAIREHLPVYDVTSGSLQVLFGHNAIDIVLESGTPLYAVSSGTVFTVYNWTIPGAPQGYAAVVVADALRDDQGDPVAFLYGHVREFDTQNGQHVDAGALIAKSGGDPDDPGHGFSDMANVHFEVIESPQPLTARASTVNPHQFLANLYAHAASMPSACSAAA
jgi:murein DD-endopeptidase MepM/ murein hydrolase activator NlpD